MLPHCTTAERIWRSRSLRRRPIRFSQSLDAVAIDFTYNGRANFSVPPLAHPITISMIITLKSGGKPVLGEGQQDSGVNLPIDSLEAPPTGPWHRWRSARHGVIEGCNWLVRGRASCSSRCPPWVSHHRTADQPHAGSAVALPQQHSGHVLRLERSDSNRSQQPNRRSSPDAWPDLLCPA